MSVLMTARAWRVRGLTSVEKLVLLKFADCADDNGKNAYPSVRYLAEACDVSERAVQYAIGKLRARGWLVLQVPGGGRRAATYCVFPDAGEADRADVRGAESAPLNGDKGCTTCTPGVKRTSPQGCKPQQRIKDDPSLIRPGSSTPPNPPQAGGLVPKMTRAERKRAEGWRKLHFGRCPHEPRCVTNDECNVRMVAYWRWQTEEALAANPP